MRSWIELSASQRTVHFRWMSFIDHVDQAAPRAPRQWATARLGRERHRAREYSAVISHAEEYEGLLVRLPSPENNSMCGTEDE